ncbi:MAG: DUF4190 domain-containing protein [Acidobacteriota bacterium]|jgi:hypothetical protein
MSDVPPPTTTATPPPSAPGVQDKASGMAITALVLGIVGIFCCGWLAGIPALIIGIMEFNKIKRGQASEKGKGFSLAGIVLGIIAILWGCLFTLWFFFLGGTGVMQGMMHRGGV